mmetsp:Transcript_69/g.230  ORF Transcript_69/g.230 Transcript_69/m.230 type:complete len:290 (+) Transcript_69:108-977(+)
MASSRVCFVISIARRISSPLERTSSLRMVKSKSRDFSAHSMSLITALIWSSTGSAGTPSTSPDSVCVSSAASGLAYAGSARRLLSNLSIESSETQAPTRSTAGGTAATKACASRGVTASSGSGALRRSSAVRFALSSGVSGTRPAASRSSSRRPRRVSPSPRTRKKRPFSSAAAKRSAPSSAASTHFGTATFSGFLRSTQSATSKMPEPAGPAMSITVKRSFALAVGPKPSSALGAADTTSLRVTVCPGASLSPVAPLPPTRAPAVMVDWISSAPLPRFPGRMPPMSMP